MRRFIIALVTVALVLASVSALATEAETVTQNFGDFNLTYPKDLPIELGEKTEGGLYFTLYSPETSEEGFTNNINCVWSSNYINYAAIEPRDILTFATENVAEEAASMGLIMTNVTPIDATRTNLGGLECILISYSYDADYSNLGMDKQASLIAITAGVSDPGIGNYNFTITASNQEGLELLAAILDSITWNK